MFYGSRRKKRDSLRNRVLWCHNRENQGQERYFYTKRVKYLLTKDRGLNYTQTVVTQCTIGRKTRKVNQDTFDNLDLDRHLIHKCGKIFKEIPYFTLRYPYGTVKIKTK